MRFATTTRAAILVLAICLALAAVRFHGLRPLDETPPISDETVKAVRELPPPSDLDSAAHLVVEQSRSSH